MSAISQFAVEADDLTDKPVTADELWRDVAYFGEKVRQAEVRVSKLSLYRELLLADEADALAHHNELWQDEQEARRLARESNARFGWRQEEETSYLLSWAATARELRRSDAVDWRYICAAHKRDEFDGELDEARQQLASLRRALQSALSAALQTM